MLNWHGIQFGALVNSNVCSISCWKFKAFLVTDRFDIIQKVCDIFFRHPYNALKSHFGTFKESRKSFKQTIDNVSGPFFECNAAVIQLK